MKDDGGPISSKTLRDYFAAAALQGQIAAVEAINKHLPSSVDLPEFMAAMAYHYADAMLKERKL